MNYLETLSETVERYKEHPEISSNEVLKQILAMQDGDVDFTTTSSPFVDLMGACAVFASSAIKTHKLNFGKIYPYAAETMEDILNHIPPTDTDEIFNQPWRVAFKVIIQVDSLRTFGHAPNTRVRVAKIPKGAILRSDKEYVIENAYEITLKDNRLPRVFMKGDKQSVVTPSDVITGKDGTQLLVFTVTAIQATMTLGSFDISRSAVFNKTITTEGLFSHVDFYTRINDEWVSVDTTYGKVNVDRYKPFVEITPSINKVGLHIPLVYAREGMLGSVGLALVYTVHPNGAHGVTDMPIESWRFYAKDPMKDVQDPEVEAFAKLTKQAYAYQILSKGREALSKEKLHERLTNRASVNNIPITQSQVTSEMERYGFKGILNNQTGISMSQNWLLSSDISEPEEDIAEDNEPGNKLITAPEAGFVSITSSLVKIAEVAGVRGDGLNLTIPPEVMFQKDEYGNFVIIGHGYSNSLGLLTTLELTKILNHTDVYYTPFYYSIHRTDDGIIDTRVYDFKKPLVEYISTTALSSNDNNLLLTDKVVITNKNDHYIIELTTAKTVDTENMAETALKVSISWLTEGGDRVFLVTDNVSKQDGAFVIRFKLDTEFIVDPNSERFVVKNSLRYLNNVFEENLLDIVTTLDVCYTTTSLSGLEQDTSLDEYAHKITESDVRSVLSLESIKVNFGRKLTYLWTNLHVDKHKSLFETYKEDVPLRYDYTSIPISSNNPSPFVIGEDCEVVFNDPVKRDDVVKDEEGNIIYLHRAGDIMHDQSGRPIPLGVEKQLLTMDILCLHAMCHFVTGEQEGYVRKLCDDIVDKSAVTILPLIENVLEHTNMYNFPLNRIGKAKTVPTQGTPRQVDKAQSFNISLFQGIETYDAKDVRIAIRKIIIRALDAALESGKISTSSIILALIDDLPDGLRDVVVTGLGGEENTVKMLALADGRDRLYIKKKLIAGEDGNVYMTEDVNIEYISS